MKHDYAKLEKELRDDINSVEGAATDYHGRLASEVTLKRVEDHLDLMDRAAAALASAGELERALDKCLDAIAAERRDCRCSDAIFARIFVSKRELTEAEKKWAATIEPTGRSHARSSNSDGE